MIIYHSTKTGYTERFVFKLDHPEKIKISNGLIVDKPYILIVPTYANADGTKALQKPIINFLNANHQHIAGVVAGGNRNFGKYFGYAGDVIKHKCNVEILHKFELDGNDYDVEITNKKIKNILGEQHDIYSKRWIQPH